MSPNVLLFIVPLTMIIVGVTIETEMTCDYTDSIRQTCLNEKFHYVWSMILGGIGLTVFFSMMMLRDYNKTVDDYNRGIILDPQKYKKENIFR